MLKSHMTPESKTDRPTKPCVICQGYGKVREKLTERHRQNPRLKLKTIDCYHCIGTGVVFATKD